MPVRDRLLRRAVTVLAVTTTAAAASLPAGSAGAATNNSVSARGTSYVGVKHVGVLRATVRKASAVSFILTGVPATGVTAVVLSVTVSTPASSGSLVGYPYGAKRPHVVSLAFGKGHTATGLVLVERGRNGRAALDNVSSASQHISATVVGYYAAPGATAGASAFVSLPPKRLASVLVKAKNSTAFVAVGKVGVPVTDVAGVVLEVTTRSAVAGSVSSSAYGSRASSSLSFPAGRPSTALVVVTPGTKGRVLLKSNATAAVRVWADVVGYLKVMHVPGAPMTVKATAQTRSALVSWTAPTSTGGAPVSSYVVTVSPGGATATASGTATSLLFRGLTAEVPYTFTVTAVNSRGSGPASAPTAAAVPYTVPGVPTFVPTTGGPGQVVVLLLLPDDDGGLPVTGLRVTASPGGQTVTVPVAPPPGPLGALTTATLGGLTPGTSYVFAAVATNAAGDSDAAPASPAVRAGGTGRVSVSSAGAQANGGSFESDISADGRYVVFSSLATNLVPGDTAGHEDVFRRDRVTGTTTLVSAAPGGGLGDDNSLSPSISDDGRYVAFSSAATNLTGVVVGGHYEVYVRDLQLSTTKLVSARTGIAADADSGSPAISGDGTTVAFVSKAGNLATLDVGAHQQIYAADRQSGDLVAVSVATTAVEPNNDSSQPTISADGKVVAFASKATNMESVLISSGQQVFERTLPLGATSLLSSDDLTINGNGNAGNPQISADGSYVAFDSLASNLSPVDTNGVSDVFVCYRACSTAQAVDLGPFGTANMGAGFPSLSANGSIIAYVSASTDLVAGVVPTQPQVFVSAWSGSRTIVATRALDGSLGNSGSTFPRLTGNGTHLSFLSFANNLGVADTNGSIDAFAVDLPAGVAGGLPAG